MSYRVNLQKCGYDMVMFFKINQYSTYFSKKLYTCKSTREYTRKIIFLNLILMRWKCVNEKLWYLQSGCRNKCDKFFIWFPHKSGVSKCLLYNMNEKSDNFIMSDCLIFTYTGEWRLQPLPARLHLCPTGTCIHP